MASVSACHVHNLAASREVVVPFHLAWADKTIATFSYYKCMVSC